MRLNDALADHVVLALVVEEPQHGFAIAKILATDEQLSQVITLTRPLVYRSLSTLVARGLIRATHTEPGKQGRDRTVYRATAPGRRVNTEWLSSVVDHPRDARVDLLAKFVLRSRRGLSNSSLARRQIAAFAPLSERLSRTRTNKDVVSMWRKESLQATMSVLRMIAD
jgi:PadR family transcriptional regulator AphA